MTAGRPQGRGSERVPPDSPGTRTTPPSSRVAIIGGGIAGIAAATTLAERGLATTVFEREPGLGGRLQGWSTCLSDGSRATMSRGFHAFFRQYHTLRSLLARVDPQLGMLAPLPDYPLWHADGRHESFAGLPRRPPWNAFALAARSPSFPARELARVNLVAAAQLLDVDTPGIYARLDHVDAPTLLQAIRFPPQARHLAFEVFTRSFFADPRQLSAAELAVMFHLYFLGSDEGLLFDVVNAPFPQALWAPLADHLVRNGAEIHTATPVAGIEPGTRRHLAVRLDGGSTPEFDAVVLATDVPGLRALVAASPTLVDAAWRQRAAATPSAPPFLVSRLWLDRPVGGDRPGFLGTAGHPTLDNISVLERFEDEARAWAQQTGGSVVELHAYALAPSSTQETERARLIDQMRQVYPETAGARIVDERHELRADCPLFPPGGYAHRVRVDTPDPWVVVAGDHVCLDLPVALMERAAATGVTAANSLLGRWGVAGQRLRTVANRGRFAPMRAFARWGRGASQPGQRPAVRNR